MKNRGFWYLVSAQTISVFGDAFGLIAMEWLVYQLTGSLVAMGTLGLCLGVPEIVVRLLGSPLIDRLNRIRLMAVLDLIRFLAYGVIVLFGYFDWLHMWQIYLIAILIGSCSALFNPASMAVVPSLVKGNQLVRGLSIMDTIKNGVFFIGPMLAGALIAFSGPLISLSVDGVSFLLSAWFIYLLSRCQQDQRNKTVQTGIKEYVREAVEGMTFFIRVPAMLLIMCLVSIKNMGSVAAGTMWIPYGTRVLHIGAFYIGMLSTAAAIGMIVGSMLVGMIGDVQKRRIPMLGSLVLSGLCYSSLSFVNSYFIALPIVALIGVAGPFFGTFSSSLYGQVVPEGLRGRVMSVRLLIGGALQPVGSYSGGVFAQSFGLPALFLTAGAIPVVAGISGFLIPALRGIEGDLTLMAEQVKERLRGKDTTWHRSTTHNG